MAISKRLLAQLPTSNGLNLLGHRFHAFCHIRPTAEVLISRFVHEPQMQADLRELGLMKQHKTLPVIERDIALGLRFKTTGEAELLGPSKYRLQQAPADPLALVRGIDAQRRQIPMRLRYELSMQHIDLLHDVDETGSGPLAHQQDRTREKKTGSKLFPQCWMGMPGLGPGGDALDIRRCAYDPISLATGTCLGRIDPQTHARLPAGRRMIENRPKSDGR